MKRGRLFLVLGVVVLSLGWVAAKGLTGNLVYYMTPTELLSKGDTAIGDRVRLGGFVNPGSVSRLSRQIRFVVSDGTTRMTVVVVGSVPSLFRAGRGVIVEGVYGRDGAFHADTVLVKHAETYQPPGPGQTPGSAKIGGGG
ncbi:MAG TPA: cytochrome c maturation protein CcmE [Actinomycetota bacterium]